MREEGARERREGDEEEKEQKECKVCTTRVEGPQDPRNNRYIFATVGKKGDLRTKELDYCDGQNGENERA